MGAELSDRRSTTASRAKLLIQAANGEIRANEPMGMAICPDQIRAGPGCPLFLDSDRIGLSAGVGLPWVVERTMLSAIWLQTANSVEKVTLRFLPTNERFQR